MTSKIPSLELTDKFIKGLQFYGLTYDEIKSNNWKYCGGRDGRHLTYFTQCCKDKDLPELKNKCICGHNIKENCYITDGQQILTLGNCCIKKFIPKSSRTCEECGEPHKNRIGNKCNNCIKKNIIPKSSKTCEKCEEPHKNRIVNKCNNCRKGVCDKCSKKCDELYNKCYNCAFK